MEVDFEITEFLKQHPDAQKIVAYLKLRKAATIYQIAEAIQESPSQFQEFLPELERYGVLRVRSGPSKGTLFESSMYMLTGFGHDVAARVTKLQEPA